jgi:hypothetical protein
MKKSLRDRVLQAPHSEIGFLAHLCALICH